MYVGVYFKWNERCKQELWTTLEVFLNKYWNKLSYVNLW